jgi:two-component system chemotaxis response regulator CheB
VCSSDLRIKETGGAVLIQSEESCVVFGMPGAVMAVGAYDQILSPDQIGEILRDKAVSENGLKPDRLYA